MYYKFKTNEMKLTKEQINENRKQALIEDIKKYNNVKWETITRRSIVVGSMKQRLDRLEDLSK